MAPAGIERRHGMGVRPLPRRTAGSGNGFVYLYFINPLAFCVMIETGKAGESGDGSQTAFDAGPRVCPVGKGCMSAMGDNATAAVHINRLREKIERDPSAPRYIQTVWGAGYRLRG